MNHHLKYPPEVCLNLNVRGLGASATLHINELSNRLIGEGRKIYKLGLGQSPFPVPQHVQQALREYAHEKDYLPVKGLLSLRQAIVDWVKRTEGLDYQTDNVLIGPGTKELMFLAQLVYYGDLMIPSPSWVSYAPQASIIGRPIEWIQTDIATGLGVTPEAIEQHCQQDPTRPRLVVLNSPGNPTSMAYSASQLQALAEVFRRYRILVISDEIYSGLHYADAHQSLARYYPEGTIISNGLSKWCGAGGWRLGWFIFPETLGRLANAMASVASETYTSICAPVQYAAVSALQEHPDMPNYLAKSRQILATLSAYAVRQFHAVDIQVNPGRGGFYLFPNFDPHQAALYQHGIQTSEQLCAALLQQTGVATLPGKVFGRPANELSMRIALVAFDGTAALQAAATETINDAFIQQHCADMIEAIQRMVGFVKSL